ncbi:MAG: SpaA isopeptide-forming pilin-related protein, partial [bacterium]
TEEMKDQSSYENWDFEDTWIIDSEVNDGYPELQVFNKTTESSNKYYISPAQIVNSGSCVFRSPRIKFILNNNSYNICSNNNIILNSLSNTSIHTNNPIIKIDSSINTSGVDISSSTKNNININTDNILTSPVINNIMNCNISYAGVSKNIRVLNKRRSASIFGRAGFISDEYINEYKIKTVVPGVSTDSEIHMVAARANVDSEVVSDGLEVNIDYSFDVKVSNLTVTVNSAVISGENNVEGIYKTNSFIDSLNPILSCGSKLSSAVSSGEVKVLTPDLGLNFIIKTIPLSNNIIKTNKTEIITLNSNIYKPQVELAPHKVWNVFDEFGLLHDLERLPKESNQSYKNRIKFKAENPADSTKKGLRNHIANELGINADQIKLNKLNNKEYIESLINPNGTASYKLKEIVRYVNNRLNQFWNETVWDEDYWDVINENSYNILPNKIDDTFSDLFSKETIIKVKDSGNYNINTLPARASISNTVSLMNTNTNFIIMSSVSEIVNVIHTTSPIESFENGNHLFTKNYTATDDYLGFADDYDICWGPDVEGETTNREYNQRLWSVYTKTAGEIYLLKSNKEITDWEDEKQLLFAPSGTKKVNIVFDKNGYYKLIVEITPANGHKEIWIMEYPYSDDAIRKLFDGANPTIIKDFSDQIIIFYQHYDDDTTLYYRTSEDNYESENILLEENKSLTPISCTYNNKENNINNLILFYKYDESPNDINYLIFNPQSKQLETISSDITTDIKFVDYSCTLYFKVTDYMSGENLENSEISIGDKTIVTDINGEAQITVGQDTPGEITVTHNDYPSYSKNIIIEDEKTYDIPLLGEIKSDESMEVQLSADISWFDTRRNVTFTIVDNEGDPIPNAPVILDSTTLETDNNGQVTFDKIIMGEYIFTVEYEGYMKAKNTIQVDDDMEITVMLIQDRDDVNNDESLSSSVGMNSITWEDTRRTVTFKINDDNNEPMEDIPVEFNSIVNNTDSSGEVIFNNVVSGSHEFIIDISNYFLVKNTVDIENDTNIDINMVSEENTDFEETINSNIGLAKILWLEV